MLMDERIPGSPWTKDGVSASVKLLLEEQNPLFQSLTNKLNDFPELNRIIMRLLFQGQSIAYNPDDIAVRDALMFGFVRITNSTVLLANRIFEMRLYNMYLLDYREQDSKIYDEGVRHGENQLCDYLDYYRLTKGYMLSFNFNKKKKIGIKEIILGDRLLIEAVV